MSAAGREAFRLVPETCPFVETALSKAEDAIKEQTSKLRYALIDVIEERNDLEKKLEDALERIKELESNLSDALMLIKEYEATA